MIRTASVYHCQWEPPRSSLGFYGVIRITRSHFSTGDRTVASVESRRLPPRRSRSVRRQRLPLCAAGRRGGRHYLPPGRVRLPSRRGPGAEPEEVTSAGGGGAARRVRSMAAAARSVLAAGWAGCGRRRWGRRLPAAAAAAPYCTVAPQRERRQPPADMRSYLWSRYKEAKRVTKGERGAGRGALRAEATEARRLFRW